MSSVEKDFEEYVGARGKALLRSAYLLTGQHQDAEDLVQPTLERVVPKWGHLSGSPDAYVWRVLHREHINRWRRRRWREVVVEHLPELGAEDTVADLDLRTALRGLAPRQRAVIVLRYYEGRTEAETAGILGVSVGTVKSAAHSALRRMQQTLAAES